MTVSLKHAFASAKADGADSTLVQPSNWNAEHSLQLATNKLLGRVTAGTGAAEEIALPLATTYGGTNLSTYTANQVFYASSTSVIGQSANLTFDGTTLTAAGLAGPLNGTVGATTPTTGVFTTAKAIAAATQDSVTLQGRAGGTSSYGVTITPTTLTASRTLTLPDASGTILQSGTTVTTAQGGTGLTSFTANGVVYASSSSALATGSALTFDGTNLGVGTSSPAQKLSIQGANFVGASFNGQSIGDVGAERIRIGYKNGTPDTGLVPAQIIADTALLQFASRDIAAGAITFATGSGIPERMRLDSSGNVLVGVTTAAAQGGLTIYPTGSSGGPLLVWNRATTTNTTTAADFRNASSSVGSITYTNLATAFITTSDYRLKSSVVPMTGALAKVAALNPVTYKWNADGSDGEGFIAHELAEVVPQCVVGEKDAVDKNGNPKYQGIDTSFLVATLTAAIQEQQALIQSLTDRIAQLEAK